MKLALSGLVVLFLAGCASFAVTNDALEGRTAQALGLAPGSFVISNRVDDGIRTDYTVKAAKNKTYSCYVTGSVGVTGRVVSDAMCTPTNGTPAKATTGGTCNDLLKAAGKC